MLKKPLLQNPVVQVGYHVPDVEAAARQFAAQFGWGPFFVVHHIKIERCTYRGQPTTFDHSAACGQAGPVMVELNQQWGDTPSYLRDMYAANESGVQHHASLIDNLDEEVQRYNDMGFPTVMRAMTSTGIEFAFMDTRPMLGYMVELYPKSEALLRFYSTIRAAAKGWDGKDPIRVLTEANL